MVLDPLTLFLSATAMVTFIGVFLTCVWRDEGGRSALLPWGVSILLGAAGLWLMTLGQGRWGFLSYQLANALIIAATALAWAAARGFDGRRTHLAPMLGGVGLWLASNLSPLPPELLAALPPGLAAAYLSAAAMVIWQGRASDPLPARGIASFLLALHAAITGARCLSVLLEQTPLRPSCRCPMPRAGRS
jgi:hypothetical protein